MPECKSRPGKSEPLLPVSVGVGLRPAKLREKRWGTLSSRVAHALLRAASALLPTPAAQGAERRVRLGAARKSVCATKVLFRP